jgi:hypothetical protein
MNKSVQNTQAGYDSVATEYAEKIKDEMTTNPLTGIAWTGSHAKSVIFSD